LVRGHWSEGRELLTTALTGAGGAPLARRALALKALGNLATAQGDYPEARSLHEEALALYRELGDQRGVAACLDNLGNVAGDQGDYLGARSLHDEALALIRGLGDQRQCASCLERLARLAAAQGRHRRGARLLGAAEALRDRRPLPAPQRARRDEVLAGLRAGLGDDALRSALAEGRAMPLEDALAYAADDINHGDSGAGDAIGTELDIG
jgi:tetratricopeptide (TPR) repeat protein